MATVVLQAPLHAQPLQSKVLSRTLCSSGDLSHLLQIQPLIYTDAICSCMQGISVSYSELPTHQCSVQGAKQEARSSTSTSHDSSKSLSRCQLSQDRLTGDGPAHGPLFVPQGEFCSVPVREAAENPGIR